MVRLLLKKKGALANKARNDGLTPLITASINGHPKVVKRLLKHAVDILQYLAKERLRSDWANEKKHY